MKEYTGTTTIEPNEDANALIESLKKMLAPYSEFIEDQKEEKDVIMIKTSSLKYFIDILGIDEEEYKKMFAISSKKKNKRK